MGTTKVSFSIHDELLRSLDTLAGQISSSRSSLIEEAIRLHLNESRAWNSVDRYRRLYADGLG